MTYTAIAHDKYGNRVWIETARRHRKKGTGAVNIADRYTYRVVWSNDDEEFIGLCAEFPSLSHLAPDRMAALQGIVALVSDTVADMKAGG